MDWAFQAHKRGRCSQGTNRQDIKNQSRSWSSHGSPVISAGTAAPRFELHR